jgi:hypothetical protein
MILRTYQRLRLTNRVKGVVLPQAALAVVDHLARCRLGLLLEDVGSSR